ncbi:MAG: baseplate J/gp47 family protein [Bacilli bacterium]|nr:baseplate J/gp47 family protein [Bacilli bacterium]
MVEVTINQGDEVLQRLWNNVISRGVVNRRLDSSRLGLLLSAIASEENVMVGLVQSYMNQFSINTCTDKVMLENMTRMFLSRRQASKSKVVLTFYRIDPHSGTIKIPAGFAVGATSDSKIKFKTISDVYLWKGSDSVSVLAYSLASGKTNNVGARILNKFATNGFNAIVGVINYDPAFGGYNTESIDHLRNRATGFRYDRDGTDYFIRQILYANGIPAYRYYLQEYIDGPGTYLICIDTTSDAEFEDVQKTFNYRHIYGVKPVFIRAKRVHINLYIAITTTGTHDYMPNEKNNLYNQISERVQHFFAAYCAVGSDINVGRLKASILSELSSYEIEDIRISFDQGIVVNKQKMIVVPNTYRVFPNKIIVDLNYQGEYVINASDEDEAELFEVETW